MSAEKSASAGPRSSPPDDDSHTIPEDAPPSYSGPLEAGPSTPRANIPRPISRCFDTTPGIIPFDYSQYLPPGSSLSSDHVTITLSAPDLLSNPFALTKFVTAQLALPPRPQVRIIGEHVEGGGKKIDFDLRLNMQRYILSPADAWNYVMIDPIEITKKTKLPPGISVESSEASIAAWARKFCKDRTDNKSFTITRTVSNWNISLLDGRLRSLLASLKYHGRISITFPSTHSIVTISPPSTFFSRLVSLVKDAAHYSNVRSVWPYADVADGATPRQCAVQDEEKWFADWSNVIARGVLTGKTGWVTLDDLMEDAVVPALKRPEAEWGSNYRP